jgi:hypothetical protein
MRPIVIFGAMLIAIGIAGLAIDNITFTDKRTIIDVGPIKVTEDRPRSIPVPTVIGVVAVVAGAGMILFGRRVRG